MGLVVRVSGGGSPGGPGGHVLSEEMPRVFQDGRRQKVKGARRRLHNRVVDGRQAKPETKEVKVCRTATTVRCYL